MSDGDGAAADEPDDGSESSESSGEPRDGSEGSDGSPASDPPAESEESWANPSGVEPPALGDGPAVEGAPIARVASRLTWPQEASRIRAKEGDETIRTPDGPRRLDDVLGEADVTYFDTRRTFVESVRDIVGRGPVSTADE